MRRVQFCSTSCLATSHAGRVGSASVAGVLLLLLSLVASIADSEPTEEWVARYDGIAGRGDLSCAIAVDSLGNVYVTGLSWAAATGDDYATVKYDRAGVQQWVARYDGPGHDNDQASAIALDDSGNVYVTGSCWGSDTTYSDYATVKYDAAGAQQWVALYNGPGSWDDRACAIAVDKMGNVYVTGLSWAAVTGDDYATVKYDRAGAQQWVARYDGSAHGSDTAHAIAVDTSGHVYVTGASVGRGTGCDFATVKYDSTGTQQWIARYDGPASFYDSGNAIALDRLGHITVAGTSQGSATAKLDYATVRYDSVGTQQWVARYNGPGSGWDEVTAVAADDSCDAFVTGSSERSQSINRDYATIKYSREGIQRWVVHYSGPDSLDNRANAIVVDNSGNAYVTGRSRYLKVWLDYDCITVKYNPAGVQQWIARYSGPGDVWDEGVAIALDRSGNVYVTGPSTGSPSEHALDYVTIKYSQKVATTEVPDPVPSTLRLVILGSNPAVSGVRIRYALPRSAPHTVAVYDAACNLVGTLVSETGDSGWRTSYWGCTNRDGRRAAAGVYFVRLSSGNLSATAKVVVVGK